MIRTKLPLPLRLRWALSARFNRALDVLYAPALSRLTHDEYFSTRTRNEAVARVLRRKLLGGPANTCGGPDAGREQGLLEPLLRRLPGRR